MEKSHSITNLASALSCFQNKVGIIEKTDENPFFHSTYAPLPKILKIITPILRECGLTFSQFPDEDKLTTILVHIETGEYMQASYNMNAEKNNPQSHGSAITYARRYVIGAMLGLNIDEDDDGNKATYPNGYNNQKTALPNFSKNDFIILLDSCIDSSDLNNAKQKLTSLKLDSSDFSVTWKQLIEKSKSLGIQYDTTTKKFI